MQAVIDHFPETQKYQGPQGGFILWIELNKKVNTFKLRSEAMKHKISIMPGRIFSVSANYSNCMRLSFGKQYTEDSRIWIDGDREISNSNKEYRTDSPVLSLYSVTFIRYYCPIIPFNY
jgi:aspartate/methionine/tyrosine aminotransferase